MDTYTSNRKRYEYNPTKTSFNAPWNNEQLISVEGRHYYRRPKSDDKNELSVQNEDAAYSVGNGSFLHTEAYAGVQFGENGTRASTDAGISVYKHDFDGGDIRLGKASVNAGASFEQEDMHIGTSAAVDLVALKHKNVQGRIGLDASTGVGFSATDVYVSAAGFGFNAGKRGVGISTPFFSLNLKPWD